ncbi:hypothetical protein AYO49_03085 [Verrucomicrobiaceae bacterium SCGC AG-212-N21]|nr:hypothetical protein AYO49_03085 [Verrucomicrobiaceae bacterium SCGC AG-212-N21]
MFVAPLLHGGATDQAIFWLNVLAYLMGGFWIAELLLRRRRPHVPIVMLVVAVWIMLQGWAMALNAKAIFDDDFMSFAPLESAFSRLPGAMDGPSAVQVMIRTGALMLVLFVACDLAQSTRWLRRITTCMAVSGIAIALIGLWQKSSPNSLQIWQVERIPETVFGPFWYHGNAATLLNLAWPLVLARVIWAFQDEGRHLEKALWTVGLGAIFAGLLLNISKAGHLLAGVLGVVVGILFLLRLKPLIAEIGWKLFTAYTVLAVLALTAVFVAVDPVRSITRWDEFLSRSGGDSRLDTARIVIGMLPQAGWFGFGPGSFLGVFNRHVISLGVEPTANWKDAHNDPLQYLFEWGYLGGVAWALLWLYPLARAFAHFYTAGRAAMGIEMKRTRRSRQRWHRSYEALRQNLLLWASLAFVGVLLHACIDFPLQIMSLQIWALALAGVLVSSPSTDSVPHQEDRQSAFAHSIPELPTSQSAGGDDRKPGALASRRGMSQRSEG